MNCCYVSFFFNHERLSTYARSNAQPTVISMYTERNSLFNPLAYGYRLVLARVQ